MTFNLRSHIREVLASSSETNIDALTKLVFDHTPHKHVREAYRQALPDLVRNVLAHAPRPDHDKSDAQLAGIEAGPTSTTGEGQRTGDIQTTITLPGGGNVRRSRAAMFRRNRFRLNVWVGDKTELHVLDCTRAHLEFAAAESDRNAESNARRARQYRRLAKKLVEREVDTVAQLSDEDIEEALSDA